MFEYFPAGLQIAIASRQEPALPLARWRAQGLVREIGHPISSWTIARPSCCWRRWSQAGGRRARRSSPQRTEGWPAGLYLAALSLQAGGPSPASATSFRGDDRFVAEYFRLELLSRLPTDEARFLKHSSVLDRMCGGLCDAVLKTTRSAQTLESLERTNCFVVPLDRRGEWYRYHHLFSELLRTELERSEPDVVAGLNRRAMDWCIANDLKEAAVFYGHAAGETDTLAGLVDSLALATHYDGRMATLEQWLGWFSDDEFAKYPAIAVYGAWLAALRGKPDAAERWLVLAEGATSAIPLSDGSATHRALGRQPSRRHDARRRRAGARRCGPRARAVLSRECVEADGIRTARHGACAARRGRSCDGRLRAGREAWAGLRSREVVYVAHAQLALLAADRGAWGEAGERARSAQLLVDEMGLGDYSTSATAHVATARVAVHEGRPDDARAALARAHRLRPFLDHGLPWLSVQVGLELTRAHLALAEPGAARTVLAEAERVLELRPHLGTLVEDARELHDRVAASSGSAGAWAMSLTGAELRLLPYLSTHLTFPEIADRLYISRNTVKSEAVGDLPQARCFIAQRSHRAGGGGRPVGELHLPAAGEFHPGGMTTGGR